MKVKVLSAVLIFSLALNLAVIGTFFYRMFIGPDHFRPPERMRSPLIKELALNDEQRHEMYQLFRKFRQTNRDEQKQIFELEKELIAKIKEENINRAAIDSISKSIAIKKEALHKKAINNFIAAKKFLSPEQQDHFLRMLLQQRPATFRPERGRPSWAPDNEIRPMPGSDRRRKKTNSD